MPSPTPVPTPMSVKNVVGSHCPNVNIYRPEFEGHFVNWILDNVEDLPVDFMITGKIAFLDSQTPVKMFYGGEVIWEGEFRDGAIYLGEAAHQVLPQSATIQFSIEFNWPPAHTPYELTFDFKNGCEFTGRW